MRVEPMPLENAPFSRFWVDGHDMATPWVPNFFVDEVLALEARLRTAEAKAALADDLRNKISDRLAFLVSDSEANEFCNRYDALKEQAE